MRNGKNMRIKIIKEKNTSDYTFMDEPLNLGQSAAEKKEESDGKKEKAERDFRLRYKNTLQANKLKKPKITGGPVKQGHSPVYE